MKKSFPACLVFIGLLTAFCFSSLTTNHAFASGHQSLQVPIDLVANWNFSTIEPGGWEGNDHNVSKPTHWQFWGETNGPKECYHVINDTVNEGDADTLCLKPTRTNQEHVIMFWQDFTTVNINQVTIQHRSRATGPSAVILIYGLNASVTEDTALPNGSLPCLAYIYPQDNNETLGYWPTYSDYTIYLSNLANTYHHYRIHWQVTELAGKPDAELYVTYCRVTGTPLPQLPPFWYPPFIGVIIVVIATIVILVGFGLFYLKQEGKLHLPKINR